MSAAAATVKPSVVSKHYPTSKVESKTSPCKYVKNTLETRPLNSLSMASYSVIKNTSPSSSCISMSSASYLEPASSHHNQEQNGRQLSASTSTTSIQAYQAEATNVPCSYYASAATANVASSTGAANSILSSSMLNLTNGSHEIKSEEKPDDSYKSKIESYDFLSTVGTGTFGLKYFNNHKYFLK